MEQIKPTSSFSSSSILVEDVEEEVKELIPSLPRTILEGTTSELALYEGFWCITSFLPSVISFKRCFQAHDNDIIVASNPKCGTTWLKALIFSIVNRKNYTPSNTPLLTSNPHDLIPYFELQLFAKSQVFPDLAIIPSPRLFSTHMPFSALPTSIKQSKCRIVYICRNPFDSAISLWHHYHTVEANKDSEIPVENFVEMYFKGISWYGPYWDNVLGYWKESLEKSNKVLFLKYEDMKEDIISCLKIIAEFTGHSFSEEEKKAGIIEEIAKMCSFNNLKNLEVNKNGTNFSRLPNKLFFRKGEVGEWVNYLSPFKRQHLINTMEEKLGGSGLTFRLST